MSRSSFTLIELLVVIAILAILSVTVVFVLNPADLIRQARDTNRLTDLNNVNKALGFFQVANPGSFQGTSTVIYVSIPDTTSTCANLGLPTLPSGYSYHCVSTSTLVSINGTGWIPANLSAITYGSIIAKLPIDPINTTSSNQYYSYIPGGSWELNGVFESEKYRTDPKKSKEGLPGVISIGSNLSLNPFFKEPANNQGQALGSDLLAGWDFTSGWSNVRSVTNSSTQFTVSGGTFGFVSKLILTVGNRYHMTVSGNISLGFFDVWDTSTRVSPQLTGTFSSSFNFTAQTTALRLDGESDTAVINITSMTLQPITQESGSLNFDVMNNAGTIQDITGNKTVTNTSVSASAVNKVNVMQFNGSTSKLDLGSDFIGTGDYSVAGWIYARSTDGYILKNGNFYIKTRGGGYDLIYFSGGTTQVSSANSSLFAGQWYHVVATITANGISNIYINGVLSGTANQASGTRVVGSTNITIGDTFDGYIYRLKGYNRILNTTEIQQLFSSQRFLFGI